MYRKQLFFKLFELKKWKLKLFFNFKTENHLMYSQPFASGHIFFASFMDTLLYQAYYKPYIIEFIRLLIGIDQYDDSEYLRKVSSHFRILNSNFGKIII